MMHRLLLTVAFGLCVLCGIGLWWWNAQQPGDWTEDEYRAHTRIQTADHTNTIETSWEAKKKASQQETEAARSQSEEPVGTLEVI